jgi:hypothetical protein
VVGPLFYPITFPIDFFFSRSFVSRKNEVAKSLGLFDIRKVSESQKHAKTKNCFTVLKPNERGLFRKPPESMVNKLSSS